MDVLDLLFRRLVLAARASGALECPVTLGEVLDELAPYASAKRDGGIDTHDDYLHALMRLASGERSLLFADDLMQDDLKAELDSPNPELSLLRTYAQTKLTVSTEGIAKVIAGDTNIDLRPPTPLAPGPRVSGRPTPARPSSTTTAPARPSTRAQNPRSADVEPETAPRFSEPRTDARDLEPRTEARQAGAVFEALAADTVMPGCPYCAQALPVGRTVKFCPSCGLNLLVKRCPGCSADIESGWTFCVTCGRKS